MIIINNGLPKSGTSLVYRYQKDLLGIANPDNGCREYDRVFPFSFVEKIDNRTVNKLLQIEDKHGDFVVKTHSRFNSHLRNLVRQHGAVVTCNYRDPRDVVLSAIDHGNRTRSGKDPSGAFSETTCLKVAVHQYLNNWHDIFRSASNLSFMIRYEDMMQDRLLFLQRLNHYLKLNVSSADIQTVWRKHEKNRESAWNFNKGTTERWRNEMSEEQKRFCRLKLSLELEATGYPSR